jgi:hypothetical protein
MVASQRFRIDEEAQLPSSTVLPNQPEVSGVGYA